MALILVVDDDPHTTRLLEETVGLGGFSILSVTGALTGLELAVERSPAMLVLNVDMPDGRRVHEHLRRQAAFEAAPIVLVGAGPAPGEGEADFWLPKPVRSDALAATLGAVFGPGWKQGAPEVGRWQRGGGPVEAPTAEAAAAPRPAEGEDAVDADDLIFEEVSFDEPESGTDPFGGGLALSPPDPGPLRLRQDTQDFTARMLDEEELATREVGSSFELERAREELALVRRELAEAQTLLRRQREERDRRDTGVQPVAGAGLAAEMRERDAELEALREALGDTKAQLAAHDGEALERALLERDREIEELEAKLQALAQPHAVGAPETADAAAGEALAAELDELRQALAGRDREVATLSDALDQTQRELDDARLGAHGQGVQEPGEGQTLVTDQAELLALAATLQQREAELAQLRGEIEALQAGGGGGAVRDAPAPDGDEAPPPIPPQNEASDEVARLLQQLGKVRAKLVEERTLAEELREELRATKASLEETQRDYGQAHAAFQAQIEAARQAEGEAREAAEAARAERDGVLSALGSLQQERESLRERAETAEVHAKAGAKLAAEVRSLREELAALTARAEDGERAAAEATEEAKRAQREVAEARESLKELREREEATRTERDAAAAKVWELEAALQERRHDSVDDEARQAQTEAVIADLEARVEALAGARAEAEDARDRAEVAREAAAEEAAQAHRRAEDEGQQREEAERARAKLQERVQELEEAAAEGQNARAALAAAEERAQTLGAELEDARARAQSLAAESEGADALRGLLEEERARAAALDEQLGQASQRIEALEAQASESALSQEALRKALSKAAGLDAELAVAREQIAELEGELAERVSQGQETAAARARAEALEAELEASHQRETELQEAARNAVQARDLLEAALGDANGARDRSAQRLDTLEAELVASRQREAELDNTLRDARDAAAQMEAEIHDATGARDRATQRLDALEAELVASRQHEAELDNTLREARDTAVQMEAELRDATLARDAAATRAAEVEEQVSELDAERVSLAERLAAEEAGRAALESELEELRRLREIEGLAEEARQQEEAARRRAEETVALTRESVDRLERERKEIESLLADEREAREFLDQRVLELTQAVEDAEQRAELAASNAASNATDERLDELQRLADQWRESFYEQQAELEALRAPAAPSQDAGALQQALAQVLDVVDTTQRAFTDDLTVWAESQRRIGQAIAQLWQIGMRFPQLQTGPMNINVISNEMKESLDNLSALLRRSDGYLKSVHDEVLGRMDG